MKYQILYRFVFRLTVFLLIAGCTKELPVKEELPGGDEFTRIVFSPSNFTKAGDLHAPTAGNEDGIKSLDVYGIAWGKNSNESELRVINIFHAPGVNPTYGEEVWGEIRGDTAVIMSSLFERNLRSETVDYVNLYAIANIKQLETVNTESFKSFEGYNIEIANAVKNYNPIKGSYIDQNLENKLKNLVVKANDLSTALEYPVMAQMMKVEGGVSYLHMPLERIYCRIGFSFLFTGNSKDFIKIDKITIDKTSERGFLFLEENETGGSSLGSLVWTADLNGPGAFKDAKGRVYTNGTQPTGGALVTLYAESSSVAPLYFRTCQYLCDSEAEVPSITLDITVSGNGGTKKRTLTAPLYSSEGTGNKKHYGFLRNHSYQVISTINTSTLKLENVAVEMRDWKDRPPVDIPEFE